MTARNDDGAPLPGAEMPPLLGPEPKPRSRGWLVLLLVLPILGCVMGFLTGAVLAYVSPKKYESRAVVQVSPSLVGSLSQELPGGASTRPVSPQFFPTELAVIASPVTLQRVVERLELTTRWNLPEDQVVDILASLVTTEQIRGTDLIEIRVRHTDPQDARDIAEAVARAYAARRAEKEMDRSQRALNILEAELRDQEDLVEEKRKVLDVVGQALGVREGEETAPLQESRDNVYEKLLYDLEKEKLSLEIQSKGLRQWEGDDLFKYAAGLNLPQNGVAVLYPEYRTEARKLDELSDAGMGDAHPQIVAQAARVDVIAKELEREVARILEIQDVQLELVAKRLEKIDQVASEARHAHVDGSLKHDYIEAKRDDEAARAMLQSMKLAHSSQRIYLKIPKHPVTIHEEPRTGRAPVSPSVPLFLGGGAVAGSVIGLLGAILIGLVGMMRREGGTY